MTAEAGHMQQRPLRRAEYDTLVAQGLLKGENVELLEDAVGVDVVTLFA